MFEMDLWRILQNRPANCPNKGFTRGSFVILMKIEVFKETFCFKCPMRLLGTFERFELSFGPIDLNSEWYRELKRM